MNRFDNLYDAMKQSQEESNREHFNVFFTALEERLTSNLNTCYKDDMNHYEKLLNNIKSKGIRVFRNSEGKHKVDASCMTSFR